MNNKILSDIRFYFRALALGKGIPSSELPITDTTSSADTVQCPHCSDILEADYMIVWYHMIAKHFDIAYNAIMNLGRL